MIGQELHKIGQRDRKIPISKIGRTAWQNWMDSKNQTDFGISCKQGVKQMNAVMFKLKIFKMMISVFTFVYLDSKFFEEKSCFSNQGLKVNVLKLCGRMDGLINCLCRKYLFTTVTNALVYSIGDCNVIFVHF